jgi:PncC family amidohydrolase
MTSEEMLLALLLKNRYHISFAESCTGGLLVSKLVSVSGASGVLDESYITYSNKSKHKLLGVKKTTLAENGAVSAKTAKEMAKGAAKRTGADIAVSVTGVAGPSQEEDKPVGLVYIGIFYQGKAKAYEFNFSGDRQEIRAQAADKSVELIIDTLK